MRPHARTFLGLLPALRAGRPGEWRRKPETEPPSDREIRYGGVDEDAVFEPPAEPPEPTGAPAREAPYPDRPEM
jgi:hypothetical protein